MSIIKKALLPAGGLGTRFLPATKASPKEMLTVVDKPLIQYAVEEAYSCGINDFIIITSRYKKSLEDHFDIIHELEENLKEKGKHKLIEEINKFSHLNFSYIRQGRPLGLGHSILKAKSFINEPFAVLLSDDIIDPDENLLKNMIDLHAETGCCVIALEEVSTEHVSQYGIIEGEMEKEGVYKIKNMVEKPSIEEAPSNLAIIGRYILIPEIFDILQNMKPGKGGEYQLTDALKELSLKNTVYGYVFKGKRYDAGDKFGFLQATVELALKSPFSDKFRQYLFEIVDRLKNEN